MRKNPEGHDNKNEGGVNPDAGQISTAVRLDDLLSNTGKTNISQIEEQKALPANAGFRKYMFQLSSNALSHLPKESHPEFQQEIMDMSEMSFEALSNYIFQHLNELREAKFNIESAVEAMEVGAYDLVKLARKVIAAANPSFDYKKINDLVGPFRKFGFRVPELKKCTFKEFTPQLISEIQDESNSLFDELEIALWSLEGHHYSLMSKAEREGDTGTIKLISQAQKERKELREEIRTLKIIFEVNVEKLEIEANTPDPIFTDDLNSRNGDKYKIFYALSRLFQIASETKSIERFKWVLDILYAIEPEETSRITPLEIKTLPSTFISPEEIRVLRLFFVSAFIENPMWKRDELNRISELYDSLLLHETSFALCTETLRKARESLKGALGDKLALILDEEIKKIENGLIVRDRTNNYVMIGIDSELAAKDDPGFCRIFREPADLVPNFPHGQDPMTEPLYNPKTNRAPDSPLNLKELSLYNQTAPYFEDMLTRVIASQSPDDTSNDFLDILKDIENVENDELVNVFGHYVDESAKGKKKHKVFIYSIFDLICRRVEGLKEEQILKIFEALNNLNLSTEFFVEEVRAIRFCLVNSVLNSLNVLSRFKKLTNIDEKMDSSHDFDEKDRNANQSSIELWNLKNPMGANFSSLINQNPWQFEKIVNLAKVRRQYFGALAALQPQIDEIEIRLRRIYANNPELKAMLINELHQVESGISDRFLNARKKTFEAGFIHDIEEHQAMIRQNRLKSIAMRGAVGFLSVSSIAFGIAMMALLTIDKEEKIENKVEEREGKVGKVEDWYKVIPNEGISVQENGQVRQKDFKPKAEKAIEKLSESEPAAVPDSPPESEPVSESEPAAESDVVEIEFRPDSLYPKIIDGASVSWIREGDSVIEEIKCPVVLDEKGVAKLGPDGLRCIYKEAVYNCGEFTSHFDPAIRVSTAACQQE
ncbi:hypothetical protein GF354_02330 [Candidatus Peregrinibacteria bacterium]|nr:hypothetical protein [Candidatus Peregrinibacteria bacterium]